MVNHVGQWCRTSHQCPLQLTSKITQLKLATSTRELLVDGGDTETRRVGDLLQRQVPVLVTHRQPGYLLAESAPWSSRRSRRTGAAPIDHHRSAVDRLARDLPHVPAVLPVGKPAAPPTYNAYTIPP